MAGEESRNGNADYRRRLQDLFRDRVGNRSATTSPDASPQTFESLNPFEQMIAMLFMSMFNSEPAAGEPVQPAADSDTAAAVMGMDNAQAFDNWRNTPAGNDWQRTHDFSTFDFDQTRNVVAERLPSTPYASLLHLIGRHESGNNYNVVFGGRQVNLTSMTVNEVLAWQKKYTDNGSPSSAAGRYQIVRGTLQGLKDKMGLTGNERFDEALQDRMALTLMRRRGLDSFMSGGIREQDFLRNLSKEWASLPKDGSNLSYYDGDGLNRASATSTDTLAAMRQDRNKYLSSSFALARENTGAPLDRTTLAAPARDNRTQPVHSV